MAADDQSMGWGTKLSIGVIIALVVLWIYACIMVLMGHNSGFWMTTAKIGFGVITAMSGMAAFIALMVMSENRRSQE